MRAAKIVFGLMLTLVGVYLLPSETTAGDDKNPAAKPLVRDVQRHKEFLKLAAQGNIDVLFIGDSITQGWSNNKVWKEYYVPLKAANFGIGGDQTGHVLWRITEGKELEGISPKVAVVMIGTNNTGGHKRRTDCRRHHAHRQDDQGKEPQDQGAAPGGLPACRKCGQPGPQEDQRNQPDHQQAG